MPFDLCNEKFLFLFHFLGELCNSTMDVITKWKKLLKSYLTDIDEQVCIDSPLL